MTDTVLLETAEGVATLTLNRPKALNALNMEMCEDWSAALAAVEHDPAVRCVIVRGAGDAFMAGGDIKAFRGFVDEGPERRRVEMGTLIHAMHLIPIAMRRMPKPVIASVHGAVAGGGFGLMLAADLVIAAEGTAFNMAYTLLGTNPDASSTFNLPRTVGTKKAMELALLSERFDAATALDLGLVNRVVPDEDLEAETAKLAARLAAGPTRAYANTKKLIYRSQQSEFEAQLQAELEGFADCASGEDFAEGVRAFVDKRPAEFTGS